MQTLIIQKAELFDPPELLNPTHIPTDLGDIFEVGSEQYYILLAQPCDLMIRGHARPDTATLVKIQTYEATDDDPAEISNFRLRHFVSQPGNKTFVRFRNSFHVSLTVLDLAVFDDEGRCRISLPDADTEKYSTLHAPWRKRFEVLRRHYNTTHKEFQKIYKQASKYQKKALRRLLLCSNKDIELNYDATGIFDFAIRRVGRCRMPLSVQLLSAYFSFLSRNPQEHELT